MARYIDADKVHEFVDAKVAEGKDGWAKGVPYEWAFALTVIDNQPTADVVPRSEVEALQREIARLEKALRNSLPSYCQVMAEKQMMEIGKAYGRREVAREIFEEIEELAKTYTFPVVKNGVVEIAKEPFWCFEPNDLAELKKKYTEEQDDD